MSRAARPLSVDEGDPPTGLRLLLQELAPTPGRFGSALRLVAIVCTVVAICEVFRLPEPAVACYIAIFVSKADAASTIEGAVIAGVFSTVGIGLAILGFMLTLSEPALRVPLVAVLSFLTMFLTRAATIGVPFFLAGFLLTFGLTYGDELQQIGLQPGSAADTPQGSIPELAYFPPEEALLHTMLWLILASVLPVFVVIAVNLLAGQDPAKLLRQGLAARLQAVAGACAGRAGAGRTLSRLAAAGTTPLTAQAGLARKFRKQTPLLASDAALVEPVGRLVVVTSAWLDLRLPPEQAARLTAQVPAIEAWRAHILAGGRATGPERRPIGPSGDATADPLAVEFDETLGRVGDAYARRLHALPPAGSPQAKPRAGLLRPDAFSNPEYRHFGLKVAIGAMACWLFWAGADWAQVHTSLVTCFFISQESLGQTVHKGILRICGCVLGAALGILTILLAMPAMTDIGQLLAAIALVTFVGGWISGGSERTAYAGLQLSFAYYLVILQGFGPTLDMQTGRDRAIGIVIGIVVGSTIFATLWPVRVATLVRARLADALDRLADDVRSPDRDADLRPFVQGVAAARSLVANDPYEPRALTAQRRAAIDQGTLRALQALAVPVAIVLRLARAETRSDGPAPPAREALESYHRALSDWLRDVAAMARAGRPPGPVIDRVPAPPALDAEGPSAPQAVWYGRLDGQLRGILDRIAARPADRVEPPGAPAGRTARGHA